MRRTLRSGFTLVELLVVMGLVVVLAALAVGVSESGAFGSQKVISGGDRVSGWLLIAKQRAIRDQRPRGVRFLLSTDPTAPGASAPTDYRNFALFAREAQYIEVPDAWVPDRTKPADKRAFLAFVYSAPPSPATMTYVSGDMSQPNYYTSKVAPNAQRVFVVLPDANEQADFAQQVSAGSLLNLPGSGASYRIDQIYGPAGLTLTANGQSYANGGPLGTPVYELELGQFTDRPPPAVPDFTYPDLGAAIGPAGGQMTPGVPCLTETNFGFTAGFSNGTAGTGGPRPLVGEPLLQLTGNTVVDVRAPGPSGYNPAQDPYPPTVPGTPPTAPFFPRTSTGLAISGSPGNYFVDVLFSPSGQVLGTANGLVILWVRDPDKTRHPRLSDPASNNGLDDVPVPGTVAAYDQAGEQVLVTVYARTGLIATHPVMQGADPFAAARDGLNSGL